MLGGESPDEPVIDRVVAMCELVAEVDHAASLGKTRLDARIGSERAAQPFADYLELATGFTVEINRLLLDVANYDPSMFAESYLNEMAPMFSVATGLSLREFEVVAARKRSGRKKSKPVEAGESLLTYRPGSEGL